MRGTVTEEHLERLRKGVRLEDGMASFKDIIDAGGTGSNHWYHVIVKEGRNRLVRRLWEALGFDISRLIRVRFGTINLPPWLKHGRYHELGSEEVNELERFANKADKS